MTKDELQELKETLAQTIENDEVSYETLKLHDQEEIGMLNSRIAELKQQIEKMKCFTNCNYSENSSCLLNNEKKEECKGCQYWRLRKMKSEIEMKVNIKDVENHIKQLEEQCEDWKADHKHNLELMKGLNNRIADLMHGYKDGFLAGLKAGRPQWHYVKDGNPDNENDILCQISKDEVEVGYYHTKQKRYYTIDGQPIEVIKWQEIVFPKEIE